MAHPQFADDCKDFNLRSYKPARKPLLNARNIRDRLTFCRTFQNWTESYWSNVLFTDECCLCQFNPTVQRICRPPNQRYDMKYVQPTVKHSLSLMVWGGISSQGRAPGATVNSDRYIDILHEKLHTWFTVRNCNILMYDGALCHQSKKVKKWLQDNVHVLSPWPGLSPDLNPIENCWSLVKQKVSLRNPISLNDLRREIIHVGTTEITQEYCENMIRSTVCQDGSRLFWQLMDK